MAFDQKDGRGGPKPVGGQGARSALRREADFDTKPVLAFDLQRRFVLEGQRADHAILDRSCTDFVPKIRQNTLNCQDAEPHRTYEENPPKAQEKMLESGQ